MDRNGYGQSDSEEREDAPAEPSPRRAPAHGYPTFSPLRFDSTPEPDPPSYDGNGYGPGYDGPGAAYRPQHGSHETPPPGMGGNRYPENGYAENGYGYSGGAHTENGRWPAIPPPSAVPPPGAYQSQFELGPPRPAEQRPMGQRPMEPRPGDQRPGDQRSGEQRSGEWRSGDPTGTGGMPAVSRYGYDPGAPTYGDTLYAPSRYGAADPDVRNLGGRHSQPAERIAPPRRRPPPRSSTRDYPRANARDNPDAEASERRHMPLWQELPLLLVVAFCLAVLIRSFLLQAFFIPSSSMEATLLVGDRVLVNKVIYDLREPERGEIVVFRGTDRWAPENFVDEPTGVMSRIGRTLGDLVGVSRPGEKDFIKRVIGLPGDRVSCCDPQGRVYVNGVGIDEPYIDVNSSLDVPPSANTCGSRRFDEVVVPAGQIFVMGDNRIVSQDARCQGPVPIENVIGRAFVVVWPSSRWATLSVPDTFDGVPPPVALGPSVPVTHEGASLGAAILTLPILATLVGSGPRFVRHGKKRRWRPRRLRQ